MFSNLKKALDAKELSQAQLNSLKEGWWNERIKYSKHDQGQRGMGGAEHSAQTRSRYIDQEYNHKGRKADRL